MRKKLRMYPFLVLMLFCMGSVQAQSLSIFKRTGFDSAVSLKQAQSIDFTNRNFNLLMKTGEVKSIPLEEMSKITFNAEETSIESTIPGFFKLFPNPASDYLNIQFQAERQTSNLEVMIRAIDGKMMLNERFSVSTNSITVNVANFESGVYLLFMRDGERIYTQKFIKK